MDRFKRSKIGRFFFRKDSRRSSKPKRRIPRLIVNENGQIIPRSAKESFITIVVRTQLSPGLGRRIPFNNDNAAMVHYIFENDERASANELSITDCCEDNECHHCRYISH